LKIVLYVATILNLYTSRFNFRPRGIIEGEMKLLVRRTSDDQLKNRHGRHASITVKAIYNQVQYRSTFRDHNDSVFKRFYELKVR